MEKDISNSQVTILIEIDGKVHMVGMPKDRLEVINELIKTAVELVVRTDKTQKQLQEFLGYKHMKL